MKLSYILAAILSLLAPIICGYAIFNIHLGMVGALGGLALMNEVYDNPVKKQIALNLACAILFGTASFMVGMALAGNTLFSLAMLPVVILIVSAIGEINRLLIKNAARFIVFFIIGYHTAVAANVYSILSIAFFAGALWTAIVLLTIKTLVKNSEAPAEITKTYTVKQYLDHWKKSLSKFHGWQFPLRITICMVIAQIIRYFFPDNHSYWILLTIAIVTQHNIDNQIARIRNRGLGTLLGVLISFIFVYFTLPVYAIIIFIGILASARVIFRETNYLLYAAVMTPLIIILLDFGELSSVSILVERLAATVIGCVISYIFGYLIWSKGYL